MYTLLLCVFMCILLSHVFMYICRYLYKSPFAWEKERAFNKVEADMTSALRQAFYFILADSDVDYAFEPEKYTALMYVCYLFFCTRTDFEKVGGGCYASQAIY